MAKEEIERDERDTEDLLVQLDEALRIAHAESAASVQAVAAIDKDFEEAFSRAQDDINAIKQLTAPRRRRR
jgi:hypothetical protein